MANFVKTLAYKNNNPFNIKYNSSNHWLGLVSNNRGFCKFESLSYGVRAGFVLLKSYIDRGFNTPSKIIIRFAPSTENNFAQYLAYCCETSNLYLDQEIDNSFNLLKFGCAMMFIECSYTPSPNMISYIIDLVKNWSYEKENS